MSARLKQDFFTHDALTLAPKILGKNLVRCFGDKNSLHLKITEIEVYLGEEDLACHASKGRTSRTEIMYDQGGVVYVYLIYGIYWLLNIVTGPRDHPQAILIRSVENVSGPGRVGKLLQLDKTFYGENLSTSSRLWIEDAPEVSLSNIITTPRIGINNAKHCQYNPWRFLLDR